MRSLPMPFSRLRPSQRSRLQRLRTRRLLSPSFRAGTRARLRPTSAIRASAARPPTLPAGEAVSQGAQVTPEGEGVVVVGSRIRRDRFNTADPVTVINRDAAVDAGFTSTAEMLQSVGVTGGTAQINDTFGGFVTEGGPGANTLSLRGLGATRTLILLNGRRIAPSGTRGQVGATDLNVLPNAIVDRIEVLNTGASSVYGSDAVAGVVNIVTLSKYQRTCRRSRTSALRRSARAREALSVTFGTSGERFSLLGSFELFDRNRITLGDVPWARCPTTRYRGPWAARRATSSIPPRARPSASRWMRAASRSTRSVRASPSSTTPTWPVRWRPGSWGGSDRAPGAPAYNVYCYRFRPNATATTPGLPGFECVTGLIYRYFGHGRSA